MLRRRALATAIWDRPSYGDDSATLTPYPRAPLLPMLKSMSDQVILALSSCPDEASARRIAHILVNEGLAACVNRVGPMASTYLWEGELRDEPEILLVMKTTAAGLLALQARLAAIHPYELPEFVAIPLVGGSANYLAWVRSAVQVTGT